MMEIRDLTTKCAEFEVQLKDSTQIKIVLFILANRKCLIRRRYCIIVFIFASQWKASYLQCSNFRKLSLGQVGCRFHLPEGTFHLPLAIGQPLMSNPALISWGNEMKFTEKIPTCPIGQVKMILWYVQFLKSKMINIELFSVGSHGEFYLNITLYVSCILCHFVSIHIRDNFLKLEHCK
jgi:hypothetical protein